MEYLIENCQQKNQNIQEILQILVERQNVEKEYALKLQKLQYKTQQMKPNKLQDLLSIINKEIVGRYQSSINLTNQIENDILQGLHDEFQKFNGEIKNFINQGQRIYKELKSRIEQININKEQYIKKAQQYFESESINKLFITFQDNLVKSDQMMIAQKQQRQKYYQSVSAYNQYIDENKNQIVIFFNFQEEVILKLKNYSEGIDQNIKEIMVNLTIHYMAQTRNIQYELNKQISFINSFEVEDFSQSIIKHQDFQQYSSFQNCFFKDIDQNPFNLLVSQFMNQNQSELLIPNQEEYIFSLQTFQKLLVDQNYQIDESILSQFENRLLFILYLENVSNQEKNQLDTIQFTNLERVLQMVLNQCLYFKDSIIPTKLINLCHKFTLQVLQNDQTNTQPHSLQIAIQNHKIYHQFDFWYQSLINQLEEQFILILGKETKNYKNEIKTNINLNTLSVQKLGNQILLMKKVISKNQLVLIVQKVQKIFGIQETYMKDLFKLIECPDDQYNQFLINENINISYFK